ncbi:MULTISPECIES: AAA family ATPase [unclassified Leptolyngbya]|uniref:AAA family ATPase n=1 Tax=unclassified Leptolyngbya TaxID=2650499 RepID=UPI001683DCEA|nr:MULTISPECIES: AAA family ATPase [unclassified Leptolyngbya]MBD1912905.1 AAA family ATPase [Leptolyngbya sp. FACHB-8]MBD2154766.1 AAA family ATPase [Leptolyngbya sp. FACHB-16]
MSDLFKGFEQLLELAKLLEEKAEKGELQTNVQINTRPLSSIPRQGNRPTNIGTSRIRPNAPASTADDPVIIPPPPKDSGSTTSSTSSEDDQPSAEPPTLQDVGGLGPILQELRELVELPLKRPDLLKKLGLEPTRGVLLVGPPGTGKTLTARALADELGVNYIAIVGPEVMGKYYGEAEGKLRGVFEKASKAAPCLVFIDEIDSLAPDRSKVEGEVEKRLVAQLLSLMDGFAATNGVLVLAATNRPDHLDPALRRPGRFDREVQFRVPDRDGRLEILRIQTRAMPLDETVELGAIADLAVGMVGADLKALCQKAAYTALRRQVPSLSGPIPDDMTVNQTDFLQAIREIKPSVLRSIEVEAPKVEWDDIGGLELAKQKLQESVEGALLYPELYQRTGAKAPRGILLWGPPGTGKTLLAKAIATQARANFIAVNGPELLSKWVGAAEQAVRELFTKARQASPCVVFVDEIDTLAPARGKFSGDSGVSDRVVGQLLTELDGLQDATNVLLVGATNRPDALDAALLRAGRLDLQIKIDLPDEPSRLAILQVHNEDRPLSEVDLAALAAQTDGWNGADLALLSNQAALEAIRRFRAEGQEDPSTLQITTEDFAHAFELLEAQKNRA